MSDILRLDLNKGNAFRMSQRVQAIGEKLEKEAEIIIRYKKKAKTLDQNGYFWEFCGKLAKKLNQPKEEVYRQLIRRLNEYEVVCIQDKAVARFCEIWRSNGIGWITEVTESKLKGCKNILCYHGISEYDTKAMSSLIDLLIEECKLQGIDTTSLELRTLYEQD